MSSPLRRGFTGPDAMSSLPTAPPDVGLVDVSPATAEKARRQRQAETLRSRAEEIASQRPAPEPAPTPAPTTASRETTVSKVSAPNPAPGSGTSTPSKVPTSTPQPEDGKPVVNPDGSVTISGPDFGLLRRAADAAVQQAEAAERRRIEDLRSGRQSFALDRSRTSRPAPRPAPTRTTGRNRR